jgi:hypothetical protein
MARNPASTPHPSFRRPTILVGSDATVLGRPTVGADTAAGAGLYGIDLDLRHAWRPPDTPAVASLDTIRIRAVWLPARYSGLAADLRADRLGSFLDRAATHNGLRAIAMPRRAIAQGTALYATARRLADARGVRIAVEVGAAALLDEPGSHLDRVANIRRFAEEWELDIALDLGCGDLAGWEAEAALMRLFPRLSLVRIGPMHTPDGVHAAGPGPAVALRTVKMLADQAFGGLISVLPAAPASPWWSWAVRPGLDLAVTAREEILATYDRINQYDIRPHESQPRW